MAMKKNKSGFVLMGVVFLVLFLSIIIGAVMMRSELRLRDADLSVASNAAFYAAEAGIDYAVFQLRRNPSWTPASGEFPKTLEDDGDETGVFSIQIDGPEVIDGWDSFWVRSTGQSVPVGEDTFNIVTRDILARVIVSNPSRFLVLTLGNLNIGSGSVMNSDVLGGDINFLVNENLPVEADREIQVNGDVYYLSSISGEDNPAVIMGADSSISESPAITFAGVDTSRYEELSRGVDGYYYDGDLNVDLSDISGLPDLEGGVPKIIYSSGDITISGEFDESILVVANGNIRIDSDITAFTGGETTPQIGLFAKNDVLVSSAVSGDLTVEAFVMADGAGDSEGVFTVEDGASGLGDLTFKGSIAARGEGSTAVDMSKFETRTYDFDSDLSDNRSIPFMPFIANIREWEEINPNDAFPPS